jgi:hypothetical protein
MPTCGRVRRDPAKSHYILSRLNNFAKGAKHPMEYLSPQEKNKWQCVLDPSLGLEECDDVSF